MSIDTRSPPAKRLSESPLNTPATFNAGVKSAEVDAGSLGPFSDTFCVTVKSDEYVFPSVSILFFLGSPSAIFRAIRPVVVYALNRLVSVWLTHIVTKIRVVVPSLADSDSSFPIVLIRRVFFVAASLFHAIPNFVTSRVFILVFSCFEGSAMRYVRERRSLPVRAPTRRCRASSKVERKDRGLVSALTFTQPFHPGCFALLGTPNYCQATKANSC